MTAEIAILSSSGIALAADSALTIRGNRVWKHTNKVFSLSPSNDIGIMIYGAGDFCGVPWEILIKEYRKKIVGQHFSYVADCAQDFSEFIAAFKTINVTFENLNAYTLFLNVLGQNFNSISYDNKMDFRALFAKNLEDYIAHLKEIECISEHNNLKETKFKEAFGEDIKGFLEENTKENITNSIWELMVKACYQTYIRKVPSGYETGIVFSGYGHEEFMPSLQHWIFDSRSCLGLRCWYAEDMNLNLENAPSSYVAPFAQFDITHLLFQGIQPNYLSYISKSLQFILNAKSERLIDDYVGDESKIVESAMHQRENKALVVEFMNEFKDFRQNTVIEPMLQVIASLPKEEMAIMAETLIEITSLRRKVDSQVETVGGPIDVALISKGDGFVWVKRKHYFNIDLNQDFLQRKKKIFDKGVNDNETE